MMLTNFGNRLYVEGIKITIPVDSDEVTVDKSFAYGTKLVGIKIFAKNCKIDDYAELSLVHPGTQQELGKLGEKCYLPESSDSKEVELFIPDGNPENGVEVPTGILYRVYMKASDTLGRDLRAWLIVRK